MVSDPLCQSAVALVRRRTLLSLAIVVPLGLLFKLYAGPGHRWFNNLAAGGLYEVFWCLLLFFIWPCRHCTTRIAITVLAATSLLEVLQLWHPWLLEQVRATFLGQALIGTTFSLGDFPYYVLGCALGWFWMQAIVQPSIGLGSTLGKIWGP
jgi:hypothetical protein